MTVIITSNIHDLSLRTLGNAHVVLEHDTADFYYVWKNKFNGYRGSLHKTLLVPFLRGDFNLWT